jgi:ribonuclease BN (tRNA processing enzyme)
MSLCAFNILGSSAGLPQALRVNAGYVLEVGERLIQFDCGGGISAAFRRQGLDPLAVERIIISHTHPDHISDLPLFVQMLYLAGKKGLPPLYIHLPGEALDAVKNYFRAAYILPEKWPFEIIFQPVPEDGVMEFEGGTVLPIRNGHLKSNAAVIDEHNLHNKMQCYSYLIRYEDKAILYSADLGSERDLFPYLKDLDLLVVESTHIDVGHLLEKTVENNVGRVVLTHIDETYDIRQALGTARKLGVRNFAPAHDGMRIEL